MSRTVPVVLLLAVVGCTSAFLPAPSQTPGGTEAAPTSLPTMPTNPPAVPSAGEALAEALDMAPADVTSLSVTDWARIRAIEGIASIASDPADPARARFIADLHQRHATPAWFASAKIGRHAATWGWDSTQLLWETSFDYDGTPVHVLGMPAEFDMAALEARFAERGFERLDHGGGAIYSRRLDPHDEWVRTSDVAIANTAVLVDRRLLVISRELDGIRASLDAATGQADVLANQPWVEPTLEAQSGSAAAIVLTGPDVCAPFWSPYDVPEAVWATLGQRLNRYEAIVFGYEYVDERPVVTISFAYADAEEARADLDARALLASSLDLLDFRREGSQILFEIRPPSDQPSLLFDIGWDTHFFAIC